MNVEQVVQRDSGSAAGKLASALACTGMVAPIHPAIRGIVSSASNMTAEPAAEIHE
ncbi:MAG: hypothetical protein ACLP8B_23855 [Xanthobacteraceae bacterium]|jgi:hypothetical protein